MKLHENFQKFDGFFFDCDGVLWEGNQLLKGSSELLELLKNQDKKVCFLSNNSTKSLDQYVEKFASLNISINKNQVITSSLVTVAYCNKKSYKNKTVFIIGEEGLKLTFEEAGYEVLLNEEPEQRVDAVIVGMDRFFTYDKLSAGLHYCLKGADFIGTNPDPQFPTPKGFFPGAGSMIGALEASLGYGPEKVCGKPDPLMAEIMLNRFNLNPNKSVMVGDRVTTDLQLALNAKMHPILVKTGFGNEEYKKFSNFSYYKVIENLSEFYIYE